MIRICLHLLLYGLQKTGKSWVSTASWFLRIWPKLIAKAGLFGFYLVSKSQIRKNWQELEDPNRA
jgi:hypothetical protein